MRTFKQFLLEVFSNPYEYKWLEHTKNWVGMFTTDNNEEYVVLFYRAQREFDTHEIHFAQRSDKTFWGKFKKIKYSDGEKDKDFSKFELTDKPTGSGDAFRVFATVAEMMRDFIKKKNPRTLMFISDNKKRLRLYRRMVPKIEQESGMRFVGEFKDRERTKYQRFIFTKREPGQTIVDYEL